MDDQIKKAAERQEQKMRERIKNMKVYLPEPTKPQAREKDWRETQKAQREKTISKIKAKFNDL